MKGYKFFKKYLSNFAIGLVALSLFFVGFSFSSVPATANNSPVYKGSSKNKVSLMINVYWGTEYLDSMLDTLDRHGVKTTFFVGGSWVRDNEEMLKKIVERGHEVGNHGFFHKSHDKMTYNQNKQEIVATHNLVRSVCGLEMNLFAPPSGAFNDETLKVTSDLGYVAIMWSKDTIDWRDKNAQLVYKRATKNIEGGDLVLMHPTAHTCVALDGIIGTIKEKGLTVAPVSEVINLQEYTT